MTERLNVEDVPRELVLRGASYLHSWGRSDSSEEYIMTQILTELIPAIEKRLLLDKNILPRLVNTQYESGAYFSEASARQALSTDLAVADFEDEYNTPLAKKIDLYMQNGWEISE